MRKQVITCTVVAVGLVLTAQARLTAQADRRTENVVLITLDGARWQEIFSGLDEELVRAAAPKDVDITTLPV
jgi:hypothetical protein